MTENSARWIKVWDPLVRIFHWSLVLAFTVAYVTGEEETELHEWSGYVVLGLIAIRLLWGFVGTRYARFSDFVRSPRTIAAYTFALIRGRASRYLGHNPLGGTMILALLLTLTVTAASGWLLDQQVNEPSPAASLSSASAHRHEKSALHELHEFFANLSLVLVFLHIGGVVLSSVVHRENLIKAMITGRKRV